LQGLYGCGFNFSSFNLPTLDESCFGAANRSEDRHNDSDLDLQANCSVTTSSNGSLIELSDDSLLFIGTRVADSPGLDSPREDTDTSLGCSPPSRPGVGLLKSPALSILSPKLTNFLDRSSGDSANISECESKMGDSPSPHDSALTGSGGRGERSMGLSSDGEGDAGSRPVIVKAVSEAKDVGYSSESQSNDETETMQQQIVLECRYAGIIEVASDSPLGEKMAIPPPGTVRPDYYCMTHVDLDSTDRTNTTTDDGGNTTDDREGQAVVDKKAKDTSHVSAKKAGSPVEKVERNGVGLANGSSGSDQKLNDGAVNSDSDAVADRTGLVDGDKDRINGSVKLNGEKSDTGSISSRGSHEDITVKSWLALSEDESDRLDRVDLAAGLAEAEKDAKVPLHSLLPAGSESDSATETQEKIRYLIDHAEDLVKPSPPCSAPSSPKRKVSPSKQTQTTTTETSSVESSCDASSENSEDSEAEEFSTATDDADETLFNSVIHLSYAAVDTTTREDVPSFVATASSSPLLDHARLRKQTGARGGKRDRPWSVVGLQDLCRSEFQPLCTSESADHLQRPHTDTDSSSSNQPGHSGTCPRRGRARVIQRAVSACESGVATHAASKRKLKYSSSSR
jgi:hypothetical protein